MSRLLLIAFLSLLSACSTSQSEDKETKKTGILTLLETKYAENVCYVGASTFTSGAWYNAKDVAELANQARDKWVLLSYDTADNNIMFLNKKCLAELPASTPK